MSLPATSLRGPTSLDTCNQATPATVQVHVLSAGHFSLPEEQFVSPASHAARSTVPSLCFLIQHTSAVTGKTTRVVFDLGLRRDTNRYSEPIRRHVATRQPMSTDPDVVKSLAAGGLTPEDINYVIYSHVHWDHVGEPLDFPLTTFVVGNGSLDVLHGRSSTLRGGHSFFEADLLDPARTIELSDPNTHSTEVSTVTVGSSSAIDFSRRSWTSFDNFPKALDVFQDGSLYIVDAPGHLPGHINLLARVKDDGEETNTRWVYLAGDACHDRRIIRKEKEIGEWRDVHGRVCCIHADRGKAEETIERIRGLEAKGVEVIFAHDVEWENDEKNRDRFFGASYYPSGNYHHNFKQYVTSVCVPLAGTQIWCRRHTSEDVTRTRRGRHHVTKARPRTIPWQIQQTMASSQEKPDLKTRFDAELGADAFHSGWGSLLALDPPFFAASVSLASVPRKKGHLSPKDQSLISLAVDSAATHLYAPGIRTHVQAAFREGATIHEVLEVIELSSTLGIHACNIGVPLLVEVLKEEGLYQNEITRPFDDNQEKLKEEFTQKRGYWHTFWEDFLRLDPEFFGAYLEFSSVPWVMDVDGNGTGGKGVLEPKMKELVYCAFDCASTHLYVPGLKLHMKNALGYGATPQEIVEVLELATLLSLHTAHVAAPIIAELTSGSAST
ncbi:AhpD-like protein [Apodospora peruviana]|uniref:AhpD-like protein n=1 Tax=Apodospora peruviana TaxID=516989 RepID=A0AAE0IRF1_9PEZI|nr:AhpD-like protein [Apodospora peruviana]